MTWSLSIYQVFWFDFFEGISALDDFCRARLFPVLVIEDGAKSAYMAHAA